LDDLCLAGRATWGRLTPPQTGAEPRRAGPVRTTPIALMPRRQMAIWSAAAGSTQAASLVLSSRAQKVRNCLAAQGASFFDEVMGATRLLGSEVEDALAELVALGLAASDSFAGLRALLLPIEKRKPLSGGHRRSRTAAFGLQDAGRWSLLREHNAEPDVV